MGQQSGIFTGDGGFDLEVGGKTNLIGGAITTTDKALQAGLNNYVSKGGITTQDIENTSNYEGDAIQVGISLGMTDNKPQANTNGLGYGTDGDSNSSTTKAGITGIAGNSGITTDNRAEYAGALENVFDAERVNEELGEQVEITQAFDQERRKIKAELNQDEKKLRDAAKEALENGDRDAWEAYSQEADKIQQKSLLFDGISGALYGPNSNGAVGYVAKAISPQVVYKIGEAFKDNDFENYINGNNELSGVGSSQHLLAHALLGAAVSVATGNDALAGGLGASAGEGTALILSKYIYKVDNPSELTAKQKDTISSIASLAGLAIGASTGNVTDAVNAGETALVAVQDNAQKKIWEDLGPRDWHNPDRLFDRAAWNDANEHNITLTQGSKEYKTLAERRAFYGWYANRLEERGIDAQWPRMAWRVVIAAEILEEWNNSPLQNKDLYNMIRSANEAIFNDVFPKLATLENTTSLTGIRAREWDARALAEEQVLVQPIYDKYAGTEAMRIYENAVRQKGTYLPDNFNWDKAGGNRLGMGSFTGDLNKPSNRWAYAMKQMGYTDATPAMMPRVNR